jgi:DNA polymerase-3 subunit epsilon
MKKKILFYDTETSGLPNWSMPSGDPSQPHVTQLAAELCDEETGETLATMDMIIRPDGWEIPLELQELTGITMERAMAEGLPADEVLHSFLSMWMATDLRCAHNESFDMRMLRIEIMRDPHYSMESVGPGEGPVVLFADHWKAGAAYCTQSNSVKIINLPPTPKMIAARRKGPKSPNLGEAYEFFTGQKLE